MPKKRTKQEVIDSILDKRELLSKGESTQPTKRMAEGGRTYSGGGRECVPGDSICESSCNNPENNWDGGDCCASTCVGEWCGSFVNDLDPEDCLDPCAIENQCYCEDGCEVYPNPLSQDDLGPCCCDGVSVESGSDCFGTCDGILGDVNGDGLINVLDVVAIVSMVLESSNSNLCADMNQDGMIDVTDIVTLIQIILSGEPRTSATPAEREILTDILRDLKNIQHKSTHEQTSVLKDVQSKLERITKPKLNNEKQKLIDDIKRLQNG